MRDATRWSLKENDWLVKAAVQEGFNALPLVFVCALGATQLSDPSDLPKNAFSIFLLLVDHLCVEHIDYALEIGLSGA